MSQQESRNFLEGLTSIYHATLDRISIVGVPLGVIAAGGLLLLSNLEIGKTVLRWIHIGTTAGDIQGKLITDLSIGIPMLAIILLDALGRHSNHLVKEVRRLSPSYESIVERGIESIYVEVAQSIQAADRDKRKLEILGLTLDTVKSHLHDWFEKQWLDHWNIVIYCIEPKYLCDEPIFPQRWSVQAKTALDDIEERAKNNEAVLREKKISVELYTYKQLPAVHGFRIGETDLFFSVIEWNRSSDKLDDPRQFYERVRRDDHSLHAAVYRDLFDNWLTKARKEAVCVYRFPAVQSKGQQGN